MRRFFTATPCLLLALTLQAAEPSEPVKVMVSGNCRLAGTEDALCFANVKVKELNISMFTDTNGRFQFPAIQGENYTIEVSCLNCVKQEVKVQANGQAPVSITLQGQSYALKEVEVMAEYTPQRGSAATISQQALEHIQPTNVADVLQLIPGGLFQQNNATGFNRISLRQSGSDDNTALGMAMVMDGVSMDNDGYRSQIGNGMTTADEYADRLVWNKGIDLKSLSTDHVQRIEIVKGISSAKFGNLSSGVMSLTSKVGRTPLQVRLKADPLTKLVYAGKGFRLPKDWGFLHTGIDYTRVDDDRRDPLSRYSRLTGQLTWNNSLTALNRPLFLFLRATETYTLNQAKDDELTAERSELYRNKYARTQAVVKARWAELGPVVDNLEFIASLDYTFDRLDRNRYVQLDLPLPMPTSNSEGENEGIFLPTAYYSPYSVENKPLAILTALNGESIFELGSVKSKFIYGAEWKRTKNNGRGVMTDMTRPPYPDDSEYVRPTPNYAIPALSTGAAYAEEQLTQRNRWIDLALNAGVRLNKMFHLNEQYAALRRTYAEPRINGAISFNIPIGSRELKTMLRAGWGQENKLPTLDYIYPDPVYKDLIVLSAYINKDNPFNHLITDTRRYNVTNYAIRPNRNNKMEVGLDLSYCGVKLSLTAFHEHSDRGFNSETQYYGVAYNRYFTPINGTIVGKRPEKSDYVEEHYQTFVNMSIVRNNQRTLKDGIEYRLTLPRIETLRTTVEINGAYYRTEYGQTAPIEYHPTAKDNSKPMPYVGIYDRGDTMQRRILNSNIWLNTHIPRYKMIFTTFFQIIWLNDVRRINGSEYPTSYYDTEGTQHEVTPDIIQKIDGGDITWRNYHIYKENYHEKEPISVTMNFKFTKEFSRHIKGSFFVNNILDINPTYRNRYLQNTRKWTKSLFGAEVNFSF